MVDINSYWTFFLKIRERLILIVDNNIRNRLPLEDIDEKVLAEMFEWYMRSELFQSDTPLLATTEPTQMKITAITAE